MFLYNTLIRRKEFFKSIHDKKVGLYTCGPTVYNYAHIGNLRTYIFEDILRRTLEFNGYKVTHAMNITDVGHLTSDADVGEDKVELEAQKEKKSVWEITEFYTREFKKDLARLNILEPHILAKATDHIAEQIELVKALEKKKLTYKTADGIYFDTSKIEYGKLTGAKKGLKAGARIKIGEKRNPTDFALWKFSPSTRSGLSKRQMEWDSPWGVGFPGWHLECSAMSAKYLGQPFDIHTGGIDHVPIHHNNEIAQSESAYDKPLANYWLHGEFLLIDAKRMGKSEKNFVILENIVEKGFDPLAFRYLCLTAHYRDKLNFTWKSLEAAQNALNSIYDLVYRSTKKSQPTRLRKNGRYKEVLRALNDDLDTPRALAILHKENNFGLWQEFEPILGLNFKKARVELTAEQEKLISEREKARKNGDWEKADRIRAELRMRGIEIEDTPKGPRAIIR